MEELSMNQKFVKTITSLAVAALLVGAVPAFALADSAATPTTTSAVTTATEKDIVLLFHLWLLILLIRPYMKKKALAIYVLMYSRFMM
jgi:hypothetical protein